MSEQVIRHRGARRDENGKLITAASDDPLMADLVAPGGGSEFVERSRDGESTVCTVYFIGDADLTNDDELTVRGDRFGIVVNDWRQSGRGGLEVLCTRGQG